MVQANPCPTPLVVSKQLSTIEGEPLNQPIVYRNLIGALQYVTNSRLDIIFSVNKRRQYLSKPTVKHLQATKRLLRYLRGTLDLCLHIKSSLNLNVKGYSDIDWAAHGCR